MDRARDGSETLLCAIWILNIRIQSGSRKGESFM